MLRTDFLALSALDALRGSAMPAACQDVAIVISGIPVVECLVSVLGRKQVGNQYALWTLILLNTVFAARAGNQVHALEDGTDLPYCLHLSLVKRLKVLPSGNI